ncbi:MAG: hypothetical protein ISR58_09140 [Anaerolineales bacterium]|nr:hypothetical protein [Chloroflexota bacterium]MBL6981343.1 hypothetical protein [Anaerolineales bacterium]
MGNTIQQVLTALTTFPGNLIYHMILAFSIAGALQAALSFWRDSDFPQGRRMVIGLGLMLGLRFLLFLSAGLAQQGLSNPHVLLPILDRTATILSLVGILWLWIFPEPARLPDAASGLLAMLAAAAAALSWAWWFGHYAESAFNKTWLDIGWELFALALLILGLTLIIIRRPNGWEYGLAMMAIVFLGHILHLIIPQADSDFPGFVRLAQMAAYPLLFTLPRRFNLLQTDPVPSVETIPPVIQQPFIQEKPRYGIPPESLAAMMPIFEASSGSNLCNALAKSITGIMLADICLVVLPPGANGQFFIQCGYDLIREEKLGNMAINQDELPLLNSALMKSRTLRLPSSSTSQDLSSIGHALGLGTTGHLLAGFVPGPNDEPFLGIVLLSPYSDRRWSKNDQNYIEQISRGLAPFLHQAKQWNSTKDELEKTKTNLESFQAMLDETQAENEALKSDQATITKEAIGEEKSEELDNLQEGQKKAQDTISRLQVENRRLGEMVESLISEADTHELTTSGQLKKELKEALEQIALLKNQLVTVEQEALQNSGTSTDAPADVMTEEQVEVFASIAQDLRQPMSSIVGYTDLLLGESVGILGALQRKFLERIRASTERLESLLDDLIRITVLDGKQLKLNPEAVNLDNAIDKAIADTSAQMREKNIILRVDLPDEMPSIHADRDALQQILIHLLKNAGAVSPAEGEIFLRAEIQDDENEKDYVIIQVADQGGGIPKEDLPRVFSRLYRADNPLIEGVGDTGVGLSIVKTLVESHEGRIWVDTEMGKGSAFNLLLPLFDGQANPQGGEG